MSASHGRARLVVGAPASLALLVACLPGVELETAPATSPTLCAGAARTVANDISIDGDEALATFLPQLAGCRVIARTLEVKHTTARQLVLPDIVEVQGALRLEDNLALERLELAAVTSGNVAVFATDGNASALTTVDVAQLRSGSFTLDVLANGPPSPTPSFAQVAELDLRALDNGDVTVGSAAIADLTLDALQNGSVTVHDDPLLLEVSGAALQTGTTLSVTGNLLLTRVSFEKLTTLADLHVESNDALVDLDLPLLASARAKIVGNRSLPTCIAEEVALGAFDPATRDALPSFDGNAPDGALLLDGTSTDGDIPHAPFCAGDVVFQGHIDTNVLQTVLSNLTFASGTVAVDAVDTPLLDFKVLKGVGGDLTVTDSSLMTAVHFAVLRGVGAHFDSTDGALIIARNALLAEIAAPPRVYVRSISVVRNPQLDECAVDDALVDPSCRNAATCAWSTYLNGGLCNPSSGSAGQPGGCDEHAVLCAGTSSCGDGQLGGTEHCDDGDNDTVGPNDTCDALCQTGTGGDLDGGVRDGGAPRDAGPEDDAGPPADGGGGGPCVPFSTGATVLDLWHLDAPVGIQSEPNGIPTGPEMVLGDDLTTEPTDPTSAAGRFQNGLAFPSAGAADRHARATYPGAPVVSTGPFTLEMWLSVPAALQAGPVVDVAGGALTLSMNPTGNLVVNAGASFTSTGVVAPGVFHRVAVRCQSTELAIFVDGTRAGTASTCAVSFPLTLNTVTLGGAPPFGGFIDDVRLTNGARTDGELGAACN